MNRQIHIIGGGTVAHIRPHLALCAPAYGAVAKRLADLAAQQAAWANHTKHVHLTRMAGGDRNLETNADVAMRLADLVSRPETHVIFLPAALCDFEGHVEDADEELAERVGVARKARPRLSSAYNHMLKLTPADKLIGSVRESRKDIFLVGFKTTTGAKEEEQFEAALRLSKRSHCNLVLANDIHNRRHMVVTPEQSRYAVTTNREEALAALVEMAAERSQGQFVRTTVMPGPTVPMTDPRVPESLRTVVEKLVEAGAYQAFDGKTVGHYGCDLGGGEFLFSRRGKNYNESTDMVLCRTEGDRVMAVGGKPSAGAATQRQLFLDHPGYDCVVHFHCPISRYGNLQISSRPQRGLECGSLQCGANTSDGMAEVQDGIKVVYLEQHGPNVLWDSRRVGWGSVWHMIEREFSLGSTTRNVDPERPKQTEVGA